MVRIPYPDPQQLDSRSKATLDELPKLNVFRMLAHSGVVLEGIRVLANGLLREGQLNPVLREIAIIRTGLLRGSHYEVHQHEKLGQLYGMSQELLAAIHEGAEAAAFDPLQRQVMLLTDDIVHNSRASDATFGPLAAQLSPGEMLELVTCIGCYTMVSDLLNTFDVDIEAPEQSPEFKLPDR